MMLLIKGATIITQNPQRQIIKKGALLVNRDKIEFVGEARQLPRKYFSEIQQILDGRGKVVLPGLINAHTHLAMSLLRGYADDLPLEEWWMDYVYPVESKFGREEVYWGSLLAMAEMIKSGTTCFTDFYYYEDEVARAAQKIGMRGVLGCGVLDVPTFYFENHQEALDKAQQIISDFNDQALLKVSLAPHMFQTTSLATYQKAKLLAHEKNLILQTHAAETKQEVNFCAEKYHQRPIEALLDAGVLDRQTLLAHCCWLTKKEIKILAKNQVSVAHCPTSNMKLASGIMPLEELFEARVNVGLGTDGACSNNSLDLFEEMKVAALIHKVSNLNSVVANAQTILDMATVNGARALGLNDIIGSLEVGKKADIIILDFDCPHLTPNHNVISHLIYSANGSDVNAVMINGAVIMEHRCLKKINEKSILSKANKIALNYSK